MSLHSVLSRGLNFSAFALLLSSAALAATPYNSVNLTLKQELGNLSLSANTKASPIMGVSKPTVKNGVAYISASHSMGDWAIGLSPKLPLSLTLNRQQGDAALDLRSLKLSALSITQQLGDLTLKLPTATLQATLTQTQGDTTITLPSNVGLRLDVKKFTQGTLVISGKTVADGFNFSGVYMTANYDSATYKVDMTINKEQGSLTVK
ncbi:hypothetical protein FNU79_06320 [Deinococcus detaillensis]|uniref:Uncharacterized protein n=1 Tax=Deinococcus detaillensis TaxID=2592048 RepID=A0A553V2Y2_9DEIO|nr:DUF4097 family beta strand repeat-containing protein [Deinococcus detaillensis]TSA86800.1 hypothetical protein FNU79_06320 [Deinococcus detaillensis]